MWKEAVVACFEVLYQHLLEGLPSTTQEFVEPEGSLSYQQAPAIGLYPEPDESSPYHPIIFI
jgi:hypothetical protein